MNEFNTLTTIAEVGMKLKYLRFRIFKFLLRPFSEWSRKKRMRFFMKQMGLRDGTSILDLGGQPMIWDSVPLALNITILNLPDAAVTNHVSPHNVRYVEGDACRVEMFKEDSFDIIFSNSVIEHVGPAEKRREFAREVRRLGKSYWVQTPSKWFPIEAHSGMPFWWFYPASLRRYFLARWHQKLPDWTHMVRETTVLTKSELKQLFPEATIYSEWFCGMPKSYIVHSMGRDSVAG